MMPSLRRGFFATTGVYTAPSVAMIFLDDDFTFFSDTHRPRVESPASPPKRRLLTRYLVIPETFVTFVSRMPKAHRPPPKLTSSGSISSRKKKVGPAISAPFSIYTVCAGRARNLLEKPPVRGLEPRRSKSSRRRRESAPPGYFPKRIGIKFTAKLNQN